MLVVVDDRSLWVWHAIFSLFRKNYDVSVLEKSPFVNNLFHGKSHDIKFQVNGQEYKRYYLLAYGIYPPSSRLMCKKNMNAKMKFVLTLH
jgi:hypothetical protein